MPSRGRTLVTRVLSVVLLLLAVAAFVAIQVRGASPPSTDVVLGPSAPPRPSTSPPADPALLPGTVRGFSYGRAGSPTKDEPQSKLWHHDGAWWAVLLEPTTAQVQVFELLDDGSWRATGVVVDPRAASTADVEWDGETLHVASRSSSGDITYGAYRYEPAGRTWLSERAGVPVAGGGTLSVSLALDGRGRPWVTWIQDSTLLVAHAESPSGARWTAPYAPAGPAGQVTEDDLSSIESLDGRVAVTWSNQRTGSFHFLTHDDDAPITGGWGALETPVQGESMADGHVDVGVAPDGTVLVAVKTSLDDVPGARPESPLLLVLVRAPDGTWAQQVAGTIADDMTRPVLVLAPDAGLVYLAFTVPSTGGRIAYKTAALDDPRWAAGPGTTVIADEGSRINDVTSTGQYVDAASDLVLLASDVVTQRYYHARVEVGDGPAAAASPAGDG